MSALGSKLRQLEGGRVSFWCPGCEETHMISVFPDPSRPGASLWGYNGNPDAPTFTPSILVKCGHYARGGGPGKCWCDNPDPDGHFRCYQCHSFVTDGLIQFLGDSTHALSGQAVPLPDFRLHS